MNIKDKAREAQITVLKKYGVLADFSGLEESALDQALKCTVPVKASEDMTFAAWCDQLLGLGQRVPVARFESPIAGQSLIANLVASGDLVKTLRSNDRETNKSFKALERQLSAFENQSEITPPADLRSDIELSLSYWYRQHRELLTHVVMDVKDVEGDIFNSEVAANAVYRHRIAEIILSAIEGLEYLGFYIELTLQDLSIKPPVAIPLIVPRNLLVERDEYGMASFEFTIYDVQADKLNAAACSRIYQEPLGVIDKDARLQCHIKVSVGQQSNLKEIELTHLSLFLRRLLESMVRAEDRHKRAGLRESLILSQLLADMAPCAIDRPSDIVLKDCQNRFYESVKSSDHGHDRDYPLISSGAIVEYFFRFQECRTASPDMTLK